MKIIFIIFAAALCVQIACAQQPDDLTVTLPTGKVLTFQSAEQKAKFMAALERQAAAAAAGGAATSAATPKPFAASPSNTPASTKAVSSGPGIANTSAPAFTADYYMAAPETWLGKPLTLSVAYVSPTNTTRSDGNKQLSAYTYNQGRPGGYLNVVAPPAVAVNIVRLCGSNVQWYYNTLKTSIIHGTMQREKNGKSYYILVEK